MTRTNHCKNPSFEVDLAHWDQPGNITRITTQGRFGTACMQGPLSTSTLNFAYGFNANAKTNASVAVVPGEVWTISYYAKAVTSGANIGVRTLFMGSNGFFLQDTGNPLNTAVTTTEWTRVVSTVTVPASAAWMGFAPVGNITVYIDAVMIEKVSSAGNYFDGSTPTAAWTGTAHSSTSTIPDGTWRTNLFTNPSFETATAPDSGQATLSTSTTTGVVAGAKSLVITPTGTNDSFAGYNAAPSMYPGTAAGRTYTLSGSLTLTAPLTGTLHNRALRFVVFTKVSGGSYVETMSAQAANVAGTTRLSVTYTLPAGVTEHFIRLYHGGASGSGTVYWDAILLEESGTLGTYFDGSMAASGGYAREWLGPSDASQSIEYTAPVASIRTNMLTNPSFEVGGTGIAAGWDGTVSASDATAGRAEVGTFFGQLNATGESAKFAATAGLPYAASAYLSKGSTSKSGFVLPVFYNASNVELSPITPALVPIPANVRTRFGSVRTAPAGTTQVALRVMNDGTVTFDAALLEQSSKVLPYFDGSTTKAGYTYAWTGTVGASTSTETAGTNPLPITVKVAQQGGAEIPAMIEYPRAVPKVYVSGAWVTKRPKRYTESGWVDLT